ncbi:MFS transporter [Catenulispora rubra]|uniref:MFS transporter n=1 Tax=Catenulispora rubra TaxID=280293 RepID=UPI0018920F82|nr:MFS transporter [Catenulispora rubra]
MPGAADAQPAARTAGGPRGRSTVWAAALMSLVLAAIWARYLAGVGGDLAAQWSWADFAAKYPGSAYDLAWYGGIHPASYSLLAPFLMAAVGVRAAGVLSVVVSAVLLAHILTRAGLRWPLPVALWGTFALWCDLAAGRVTFAIGLMFGLAAIAAAGNERTPGWGRIALAAGLSFLAVCASPVAGLFVEVAAAALLLTGRVRTGIALGVPGPAVVLLTSLLFPFGGVDPVGGSTIMVTAGCAVAAALLVPGGPDAAPVWRVVRIGALLYAAGAGLTLLIDTPLGSNVERLALIFGSVVFLAALCARGGVPWPRLPRPSLTWLRTGALVVAFAIAGYWTVSSDIVGIPMPSSKAQGAGLVAELQSLHVEATGARVEAVPMQNHWESWGLTGAAELARGWNRQADVQRNPLFYDGTLTGPAYYDWLQKWAVGYVAVPALPAADLDYSARAEAVLIATHPAWLRQVWQDSSWRLLKFTDAVALASPPATIVATDPAHVVLDVPQTPQATVTATVRVQWSPWLRVDGPAGACLVRDGDWTQLQVSAPGRYTIDSDYSLPRGSGCSRP